ncbi:hypothetical protein ACLF6K_38120 (plasmid) [Streptomyces xanthophaeus]|uniref:hypothetical protein n=1 Tax=Streptomyces xanthophaeus TaxID=67385 RepID=UPI00398FD426
MSVGFRPTPADNEIIQAHKRPEESTSDVLRRALRALDRQKWDEQARQDMERIAATGEDLSDEPDDWSDHDEEHPAGPLPWVEAVMRRVQAAGYRVHPATETPSGEENISTLLHEVTVPDAPAFVPATWQEPGEDSAAARNLVISMKLLSSETGVAGAGYRTLLAEQARALMEGTPGAAHAPETSRPPSMKLARLHAARARRAGKR